MPTWTEITTTWDTEPNTWAGTIPPAPDPIVGRWQFYDPLLGETYNFEINPTDGGNPTYNKRLVTSTTLGLGRRTLIVEGSPSAQTIDFSGVTLSAGQLDTFVNWASRRRPIRLTDDLGRQWLVYIRSLQPDRKRKATAPYEHSYKISTLVVG